jgi:hypothetical protein
MQPVLSDMQSKNPPRKATSLCVALLLLAPVHLASLSGCSAGTSGGDGGGADGSIFGKVSIPVRAVVVTRGQRPYPLESLEIRASPASAVAPRLKAAAKEYERRAASIVQDIEDTKRRLTEENRVLDQKKQAVANDYNGKLPEQADLPPETSRDDLEVLTKMRAQKSRAVRASEADLATAIRPIEEKIQSLQSECRQLERDLQSLRRGFKTTIFESLPDSPSKKWVTDLNGYATVSISRSEPWYFWSDTERDVPGMGTETYRWILMHPDDLDDAGKMFFDHRNLLDSRGLVVDADTGRLRSDTTFDRRSY